MENLLAIIQAMSHLNPHVPHPHLESRALKGPPLVADEHIGINGRLALWITNLVSTMWCAYLFGILALISLPSAIDGGTPTLISWLAQTFLQLVLLSIIMVGQKVSARAADKRSQQTYEDAEILLKILDETYKVTKETNDLVEQMYDLTVKPQIQEPKPIRIRASRTKKSKPTRPIVNK